MDETQAPAPALPPLEDVYDALRQAHAAGDAASAQRLTDHIRARQQDMERVHAALLGADAASDTDGARVLAQFIRSQQTPAAAAPPPPVPAFPNEASDLDDQQREIQTGAGLRGAGSAAAGIAAGALLPEAAPGAAILARIGLGALNGAGSGAASGAVAAGPGNRTMGAVFGAGAGGVLGAAGPPLMAAGGMAVRPAVALIQRLLGAAPSAPAGNAAAIAAASRALAADSTTPAELQAQLAQARASGQPMAPVDVAGPNLRGLARATITQPGVGQQIATDALNSRVGAPAQARIAGFARQAAGNPSQAATTAAYERAYPQELDDPAFSQLLESYDPFRTAHAQTLADPAVLAPPAPLFNAQGKLVRTPTVRDVDAIKKIMDARTESLAVPGSADPALVPGLRDQSMMRGQMVDAADQLSPDYATARALAQRTIGLRNINDTLAQTANRTTQDFATPIGGALPTSQRAMDLSAQFPGNPDGVQTFIRQLQNERTMLGTNRYMLGNSATANKLAESDALDNGIDLAGDAMHVAANPTSGLLSVGMKLARAGAGRFNAARNSALATPLFDTGDAGGAADDFLRQLDQVEAARSADQISGGASYAPAFAGMGAAAVVTPPPADQSANLLGSSQ
jgi:hypothetical protein